MNRRSFLGIAPLGILGVASLAQSPAVAEQEVQINPEVKKAKNLVIMGADGQKYHPLVVSVEETRHEFVALPNPDFVLTPK